VEIINVMDMKKLILVIFLFCYVRGFAQNINKIEYFIDSDPGFGLGVNVPVTANTSVTANFTIALPNTIPDGFHYLSVRAKDVNNNWGITSSRPFYKEVLTANSTPPNISQIEYFVDADPGFGLGINIPITANNPVTTSFTIALPTTIGDGFHYLSIRAKDTNNKWTIVATRPFYKEAIPVNSLPPTIIVMEYFVDADPGYGLGVNVPITAGTPINKDFTATLGNLSNGTHKLTIRGKDSNNQWGIVGIKEFVVQDNIVIIGNIPTSWCKNTSFNIEYTATGVYPSGNIFTAQLSDATGSFTNATTLGSISSTGSGSIVATIPNTVTVGNGYLVRVISSTPSITNNPVKNLNITALCECLTNISLMTGNWGTPTIWSCGHIPLVTELVQISEGHTITLDVNGVAKSVNLLGILNPQISKVLTIQGN
jgi:hypothetical protein